MTFKRRFSLFLNQYFIKKPTLRRAVTRLFEGDRDLEIDLLGNKFTINSVKEHGYLRSSRLSMRASFLSDEIPVLINLANLLSNDDTFVDVGANIGIFSCTLARLKRLQPHLNFYAFEANPDTYARLKGNGEKFGIQAVNLAISDRDGKLEFVSGAVSHVFTTVQHASAYSIMDERQVVECTQLDSILFKGSALVIKIDVEGQELEILKGAKSLLHSNRIKAIYLDGYAQPEVLDILTSHNFSLYDGRTLAAYDGVSHSVLAVNPAHLPPGSAAT
jgi:FkbM family methyltransferase